jgi:hypothetical protein
MAVVTSNSTVADATQWAKIWFFKKARIQQFYIVVYAYTSMMSPVAPPPLPPVAPLAALSRGYWQSSAALPLQLFPGGGLSLLNSNSARSPICLVCAFLAVKEPLASILLLVFCACIYPLCCSSCWCGDSALAHHSTPKIYRGSAAASKRGRHLPGTKSRTLHERPSSSHSTWLAC